MVVAVAVLGPAYLYIGVRIITSSELPSTVANLAWVVLLTHLVLLPFSLMSSRVVTVPSRALDRVHWVAYTGMGFLALVLPMLWVRDLAGLAWTLAMDAVAHARVIGGAASVHVDADLAWMRAANLGVVLLALVLTGRGFGVARRTASVRNVRVPIDGLPDAFDGYRIVQISDVHVGPTIRVEYVRGIVDAANALGADLVALTGDLVDGSVRKLGPHVAPFGGLRSRDGVFFVTGNHEYYSGPAAWVRELARLGVTPLVNQHRVIERGGAKLLVAGVTDALAGRAVPGHRSDPDAAVAGAPQCDVRLMLAHQPSSSEAAARLGFHLQLSGHTHGGQFFPWHLVVRLVTPYLAGLFRVGTMWLYVSRGTGYWGPPLRLGAPSEITLLELTRA